MIRRQPFAGNWVLGNVGDVGDVVDVVDLGGCQVVGVGINGKVTGTVVRKRRLQLALQMGIQVTLLFVYF